MRNQSHLAVSLIALWSLQESVARCQSEPAVKAGIPIKVIGTLECVDDGEHRLGAHDRMFLIEDQWEFHRCTQIIPELPKVDFDSESILVIASWKYTSRSLKAVRRDGEQLVLEVDQQSPPGAIAGSYHPPKFLVFVLPAWQGPVRFVLNGREDFTLLRGDSLATRVDKMWSEILRVHSGGFQTKEQRLRYYRKLWPTATEEELLAEVGKVAKQRRPIDFRPLYRMLFRDLIDLRAKPAVPRIFALIEAMGKHDKAFDPAWKTLVAIGGPEVVAGCRHALKSWNSMSRHAAILILRDLGLPETRELAYAHLVDPYMAVGRCSLDLLHRLGHEPRDVPELLRAIRELEANMLSANPTHPKPRDGGGGVYDILTLIRRLGHLGPKALAAIPELEEIASNPKFPESTKLKEAAREALSRIRNKTIE